MAMLPKEPVLLIACRVLRQRPLQNGAPQPWQKKLTQFFETNSTGAESVTFLCAGTDLTGTESLFLTLHRTEEIAAAAAAAIVPLLRTPTVTPIINAKHVMAAINVVCGGLVAAFPALDFAADILVESSVGEMPLMLLGASALAAARCSESAG